TATSMPRWPGASRLRSRTASCTCCRRRATSCRWTSRSGAPTSYSRSGRSRKRLVIMLGRTYEEQVCSIARAPEVRGERWRLLVVRDALLGLRRFDEFRRSLGIASNVLTDRLARLVDARVMERLRYHEH